tara:strand:- start:61578 stop:62372 length:795 start_codon:yes stop_codon:yes gene_type:complete
MPIRIKCPCGKALAVKDEMAGKAVKCPGCGKVIRVPAAGQPQQAMIPAASPQPAAQLPSTATSSSLQDLFDEEGFSEQVAAVCPSCKSTMTAGAVLCTNCGFNKETGQRMQAHQTAGVDIDHGTLQLQAAEASMKKDAHLQKEMESKAGLPWWGLALVLFIGVSGVTIATLAVNAARRVDETMTFNPMKMFYQLSGGAMLVVAAGALLSLIVGAFQRDRKQGLLMLTVLYIPVYVFKNFKQTYKPFITAVVVGIGGGVLLSMGL